MKIGLILDRAPSSVMAEVLKRLHARRVIVEPLYSDEMLLNVADCRIAHDWYLLKGGSPAALTFAGMLHHVHAKIMHPYPTTVVLRNKLLVMQALSARGVPTPETFLATQSADLRPLLTSGPLILKPNDGRRGEGIQIVAEPAALKNVVMSRPFLAQRYYPPDGESREPGESPYLKIYRIGDEMFGIWRLWPTRTDADKIGELWGLTPEIRQIVLTIGAIFGLTLYGLDLVISGGRPYVVDVNCMGGCTGVPDAPELLAAYYEREGSRLLNANT